MTTPAEIPVPSEVAPFVEALGVERAIALFMAFGGSMLYIAENPTPKSSLVKVIGVDAAKALHAALSARETWQTQNVRVPTAKPWIARHWRSSGVSTSEIARRLHTADKTVRGWLKREHAVATAQLSLL